MCCFRSQKYPRSNTMYVYSVAIESKQTAIIDMPSWLAERILPSYHSRQTAIIDMPCLHTWPGWSPTIVLASRWYWMQCHLHCFDCMNSNVPLLLLLLPALLLKHNKVYRYTSSRCFFPSLALLAPYLSREYIQSCFKMRLLLRLVWCNILFIKHNAAKIEPVQ